MKLPIEYYRKSNVVSLAKSFLGKYLFTYLDGKFTGGIITETEAYNGIIDKASHAFGGRRTNRTEIMYADGGTAYVYLCYGIHSLFNIVTNRKDIPHAILIRALFPIEGLETMMIRTNKKNLNRMNLFIGPGLVSKALGIHYSDTGKKLNGNEIWIEDRNFKIPNAKIITGPRVGVEYAGKDAALPSRFRVMHKDLEKII